MCKFAACVTCFAGSRRSGSRSASKPIESGRGADVQKPWSQMFLQFELLYTETIDSINLFRFVSSRFNVSHSGPLEHQFR